MRRFLLLAGLAVVGGAGPTMAQQMPGQSVGKPLVAPVGMQLPQAATPLPRVGSPPPGYGGLTSGNAYAPPKSTVDPKLVAAPVPQLTPAEEPKSFWDRMYDRWRGLFGLDTPATTQRNWTPGIGRRNRDRKDDLWRRD